MPVNPMKQCPVTVSNVPRQAVLYTRVSSKEQELGYSIPAQQELLRSYGAQLGLVIEQELSDAETAKITRRPGFVGMVRYFKQHPACRVLLVEKNDRLYRNFKDYLTIDELDLEIHLVQENVILTKDSRSSEKFMHGIKVLMAKNYVDNLSEEVKKGLREKAEQGHWPGVAHVGYVNNRVTRRIDIDPVRGPLVGRVFQLYGSGEYSLKALRARAHDIGLRHWRGDRTMTISELHRML